MVDLHSSREAGSAQGPPSATERRECKSRVTLLLRDADSGQIDHMAAEPTHGPHHPCTSSSRLGARGTLLPIGNLQLAGGSSTYLGARARAGVHFSLFLVLRAPALPVPAQQPVILSFAHNTISLVPFV